LKLKSYKSSSFIGVIKCPKRKLKPKVRLFSYAYYSNKSQTKMVL